MAPVDDEIVALGLARDRFRNRRIEQIVAFGRAQRGATEAIMLAYGFKTELLVELVNAGLATASVERMVAGGRRIEVTRMRITGAGRRAFTKLRWP
jgi:hypothetical protein